VHLHNKMFILFFTGEVTNVHFTQLTTKKVYPTWIGRYYQYRFYIHYMPVSDIYYFICSLNSKTIYDSVKNNVYFTEFKDAEDYANEWAKKNCTERY
jgi:hypothetical protein